MSWWPWKKKEPEIPAVERERPVLGEADRITNYFASGGEIIDISNKPRLPDDGFPPDTELMQPFNEAHRGIKSGLRRAL